MDAKTTIVKLQDSSDWYWDLGLHDAAVLLFDELELPYDYKKRNPFKYKKTNDDSQLWWISDTLENIYEGFILTISFQDLKGFPEEFDFIERFENAEVIRR